MKLRRVIGNAFIVALVVAVLGMCLVDLAHAVMPRDGAPMNCATLLCDGHTGCVPTSAIVLHALPIAMALPAPTVLVSITTVSIAVIADPPAKPRSHVFSLASRSPPLA